MGLQIIEFPKWDVGDLYRRASSSDKKSGQYSVARISNPINFPFPA
jgi:hypothetical protein